MERTPWLAHSQSLGKEEGKSHGARKWSLNANKRISSAMGGERRSRGRQTGSSVRLGSHMSSQCARVGAHSSLHFMANRSGNEQSARTREVGRGPLLSRELSGASTREQDMWSWGPQITSTVRMLQRAQALWT